LISHTACIRFATDDDSLPRRRKRQPGKPNKDSKARQKRQ
jgi:hypothetical protein